MTPRLARYVPDELRVAELYGRPVCPVWVAREQWMECVPLGWGGAQYIDARGARYETALQEIVATAQDRCGHEGPGPERPVPPPLSERSPRNPYKGLCAFAEADARDFFGRERLITELVAAMRPANDGAARFLAVVGPSGSGKSSVVLAGLLPRLRGGTRPGSARWL